MIHVIGDSHVGVFAGLWQPHFPVWPERMPVLVPGFAAVHLGPALAYHLVEPEAWSRANLFHALGDVPAGAAVLLVFGEIDCRAHLLWQAERQRRAPAELAAECAERYLRAAAEVRALGYRVMLWGVVPSARDGAHAPLDFPAMGTCRERNAVTRSFNAALAALCRPAGLGFASVFDALVTADGLNRAEYYGSDGMHLGAAALPLVRAAVGERENA